jgi:hypothetical protein
MKLINAICRIRHCDYPARYNYVTTGHPNGDTAVSYCDFHATVTQGHWDESPVPYSITITGPIK